jgi:hypothetical protein
MAHSYIYTRIHVSNITPLSPVNCVHLTSLVLVSTIDSVGLSWPSGIVIRNKICTYDRQSGTMTTAQGKFIRSKESRTKRNRKTPVPSELSTRQHSPRCCFVSSCSDPHSSEAGGKRSATEERRKLSLLIWGRAISRNRLI